MGFVVQWVLGLFVSLVLGGLGTWAFLICIRKYQKVEKEPVHEGEPRPVPSWLTGVVERLFFTVIIALDVSGAAIAMIGWITVKMVTNWNRPSGERDVRKIRLAFSALLAGLISMLFATIGGWICRNFLDFLCR